MSKNPFSLEALVQTLEKISSDVMDNPLNELLAKPSKLNQAPPEPAINLVWRIRPSTPDTRYLMVNGNDCYGYISYSSHRTPGEEWFWTHGNGEFGECGSLAEAKKAMLRESFDEEDIATLDPSDDAYIEVSNVCPYCGEDHNAAIAVPAASKHDDEYDFDDDLDDGYYRTDDY
jgi:hypothetical protein